MKTQRYRRADSVYRNGGGFTFGASAFILRKRLRD